MSLKKYTRKEIESRNSREDAVIIIDNVVYNVTEFLHDHPGGLDVLVDNAGKDASKCFHDVGHSEIAMDWRQQFVIGEVVDEDKWEVKPREAYAAEKAEPMTLSGIIHVWGPPVVLAILAVVFYNYMLQ